MKKLSLSLVALVAMAICAQAVNSVNIVGVNTVQLEGGKRYIMSARLYDPAGDGTNTPVEIFGTDQLIGSPAITSADNISVFNTVAGMYQTYAVAPNGHFYKANNQTEWSQAILADDDVIEVGQAFWVVHPTGAATIDVTLYGEVLGGATDTQDVAIVTGYQLASSPYAAEVAIQDVADLADGATGSPSITAADRIVTWDPDTSSYQVYALAPNGNWYKANNQTEWSQAILATDSIGVTEGYWYISQGDFTLTDGCPYSAAY